MDTTPNRNTNKLLAPVLWAIIPRHVSRYVLSWIKSSIIPTLACLTSMLNVYIKRWKIPTIKIMWDGFMVKYPWWKIMSSVKICMEYKSFSTRVPFRLKCMSIWVILMLAVMMLPPTIPCLTMPAIGSMNISFSPKISESGSLKGMLIIVYPSLAQSLGWLEWEMNLGLRWLNSGENGGFLGFTNMRIR